MVACVGFVVSGVDASELFDFAEIILDEMAPFVNLLIVGDMDFPIALCRNDSRCTAFLQGLTQTVGIERLVAHQGIEGEAIDQIRDADDLAALAGKQFETNEIAQGIGERKNLGRQSAFRAPNGLIESPPFAPLAFW